MELFYGLFILACVVCVYFLPAIVAHRKYHRNSEAIFILNLLMGWTGFGWVLALVWAATNPDG